MQSYFKKKKIKEISQSITAGLTEIYDPEIKPKVYESANDYVKSDAPTINHFYEKLLLLKDKMNTATGKKIALERHQYMENFLSQFYAEWEGEK